MNRNRHLGEVISHTDLSHNKLYEDIKASTNIINDKEYRDIMIGIAKVAADMVKKTLGPYGATTIIDDGHGFSYPTKDGWSTLSKLRFNDPLYNTMYQIINQVSFNSVTSVGDGTTTAMVAAANFISSLYDFIEDGNFRQAEFISLTEKLYDEIEDRMIHSPNIMHVNNEDSFDDIYKIAYTATNGNEKFSRMIQRIYQETNNPNIHVHIASTNDITEEIQEGYKFDAWTMNFKAYINTDNETCEKITPSSTIIFDHNVTYNEHKDIILALTNIAAARNIEIVIIAPYFDEMITSILSSSIQNMYTAGKVPNIILMKIPYTMNYHKKCMKDLAVLTNGTIFDVARLRAFTVLHHNATHDKEDQIDDEIIELEEFKVDSPQDLIYSALGRVNKLVISKDIVFVQGYDSIVDSRLYKMLIDEAKEEYNALKKKTNKTMNGTLDKDFMDAKMRYVNLLGKIGVIHVGGISDIQRKCDKDSIDDAVLVCKSAYENGYVRGFNLEILTVLSTMIDNTVAENEENENNDDFSYKEIILRSLYEAFLSVCVEAYKNKYSYEDYVSCIHCREKEHHLSIYEIVDYCIENVHGYNMVTERFDTMNDLSVISSVSNDLEIVKSVINILTLIVTSNQFISLTKNYDRDASHMHQLEKMKEDKKELTAAATDAIVEALLANDKVKDLLRLIKR